MFFLSPLTSAAPYSSTASPMPSPSLLGSSQAPDATAKETTKMLMAHTEPSEKQQHLWEPAFCCWHAQETQLHTKPQHLLVLPGYRESGLQVIGNLQWILQQGMCPRDNLKLNFVLTQLFFVEDFNHYLLQALTSRIQLDFHAHMVKHPLETSDVTRTSLMAYVHKTYQTKPELGQCSHIISLKHFEQD